MANKKRTGWLSRHLKDIRSTIFEDDDNDSAAEQIAKRMGWYMLLILVVCGTSGIIFAASFAH